MQKQLFRSQSDRVIAGICGGIAEYFDIDSTIVRVLFVLFAFMGGSAIIIYFILWVIVPEEEGEPIEELRGVDDRVQEGARKAKESFGAISKRPKKTKQVMGILFILFGGILLLQQYIPQLAFKHIWPVLVIAFGSWLLFRSFSFDTEHADEDARKDSSKDTHS